MDVAAWLFLWVAATRPRQQEQWVSTPFPPQEKEKDGKSPWRPVAAVATTPGSRFVKVRLAKVSIASS